MFPDVRQKSKNGEHMGRTIENMILTGPRDESETKPIEIDGIYSVVFLADGSHIVSGGEEGKIRRWRVEDGRETAMLFSTLQCHQMKGGS